MTPHTQTNVHNSLEMDQKGDQYQAVHPKREKKVILYRFQFLKGTGYLHQLSVCPKSITVPSTMITTNNVLRKQRDYFVGCCASFQPYTHSPRRPSVEFVGSKHTNKKKQFKEIKSVNHPKTCMLRISHLD